MTPFLRKDHNYLRRLALPGSQNSRTVEKYRQQFQDVGHSLKFNGTQQDLESLVKGWTNEYAYKITEFQKKKTGTRDKSNPN